jgi:hypothetical protein
LQREAVHRWLVRLLSVVRRGFDAAGHFGLPFFFLISLLAGVERGGYGSGLASGCFACGLGRFTDPFRRLRVKFTSTSASRFVVFAGAVALLLGRFTRTIDTFAGRVGDVATQFLARFGREQQGENGADATADEQIC